MVPERRVVLVFAHVELRPHVLRTWRFGDPAATGVRASRPLRGRCGRKRKRIDPTTPIRGIGPGLWPQAGSHQASGQLRAPALRHHAWPEYRYSPVVQRCFAGPCQNSISVGRTRYPPQCREAGSRLSRTGLVPATRASSSSVGSPTTASTPTRRLANHAAACERSRRFVAWDRAADPVCAPAVRAPHRSRAAFGSRRAGGLGLRSR